MNDMNTRHGGWPAAGSAGVLGLGLCLLALAAAAATNTVSDPVGFVRLAIAPTNEVLVALPLEAFDPDINALLRGQLTGATNEAAADAVRRWDASAQGYLTAVKADGFGDPARDGTWFEDFALWATSGLVFYPGDGFWIRNSQQYTQQVFLCGSAVLDDTVDVRLNRGLNLFGYPFAAGMALNSTALRASGAYGALPATNADGVADAAGLWSWLLNDPASTNDGKWVDAAANPSAFDLGLGSGYWYYRAQTNGFDWIEPRPYPGAFALDATPPVITAMTVSTNGAAMTLAIRTTGEPGELLEIYTRDVAPTGGLDNALWAVAETGIAVNGATNVEWTDFGGAGRPAVNGVYSRFYLAGRGDVDADGDGLPDSRERFVLGTDPLNADTDGDGLPDGLELEFGKNPLSSNVYFRLPFVENFETNTCAAGDVNGQNGWESSPAGAALVQTGTVCEGSQALRIYYGSQPSSLRHLFAPPASTVVWGDFLTQVAAADLPSGAVTGSAVFCFSAAGQPVVYDGLRAPWSRWAALTNVAPRAVGTWVRVTVRLDYAAQEWDLFLDAQRVAQGLGFASYRKQFAAFGLDAGQGLLDGLGLTTTIPLGIDQDQDGLPDWWEMLYFGNLNQTANGDPDGDGLTNLQEYQLGTNPTLADTDGDGMSDGMETYFGNNPLSSNAYARLPFVENFETNTCAAGDLNGQNGWLASPAGAALVQTGTVYEGSQALALDAGTGTVAQALHLFAQGTDTVVWLDFRTRAIPSAEQEPGSSGAIRFDSACRLCFYDGQLGRWAPAGTAPVAQGAWVRITAEIDYGRQTWRLFQDGALVADNIGMGQPMAAFAGFSMRGKNGFLDQFSIGASMPSSPDTDGDGIPDLAESAVYGTDPLNPDSDGDGVSDGAEIAGSTNPLQADQGSNPGGPVVTVLSPEEGQQLL